MTDFLLQFVPLVSQLSIPGAVVIVFVILWRSKVLGNIALKLQNKKEGLENQFNQINNKTNSKDISDNEGRIVKLESFQFKMETNHNTDLERIKQWKDITEPKINRMDERLDEVSRDVAFIRGKLNGQLKQ